jgi:hypothetical protein
VIPVTEISWLRHGDDERHLGSAGSLPTPDLVAASGVRCGTAAAQRHTRETPASGLASLILNDLHLVAESVIRTRTGKASRSWERSGLRQKGCPGHRSESACAGTGPRSPRAPVPRYDRRQEGRQPVASARAGQDRSRRIRNRRHWEPWCGQSSPMSWSGWFAEPDFQYPRVWIALGASPCRESRSRRIRRTALDSHATQTWHDRECAGTSICWIAFARASPGVAWPRCNHCTLMPEWVGSACSSVASWTSTTASVWTN